MVQFKIDAKTLLIMQFLILFALIGPNFVSFAGAGADQKIYKLLILEPGNEDGLDEKHVRFLNENLRKLSSSSNCNCCEAITYDEDVRDKIAKWMKERDNDAFEQEKPSLGKLSYPNYIFRLNVRMANLKGFWEFTLTLTNFETGTDQGPVVSGLQAFPPSNPSVTQMEQIRREWSAAMKEIFDELIGCPGG